MLDFKSLNRDDRLLTTQQLSELLETAAFSNVEKRPLTELESTLTDLIARPDEFLLELPTAEILEDAAYYSRFDRLFGNIGLGAKIMTYHAFRAEVNDYQVTNNISSLVKRQVRVGELSIEYLSQCVQLTLLDSDRQVLEQEITKLFDYFVSIAATNRYQLLENLEDETKVESTLATIENCLVNVKYADICTGSRDWKQTSQNTWSGISVDRYYPDSVDFFLIDNYDDDDEVSRHFVLENRSVVKPWL
jgi:hypothetical protein